MEFINRITEADNLSQIVSELLMQVQGDFDSLGSCIFAPGRRMTLWNYSRPLKARGHNTPFDLLHLRRDHRQRA